MEVGCNLEVDVNGEEIFMVDKKLLSSFSGRFGKMFGNSTRSSRKLKVIFDNFPGGAQGFELMARFCYNNGTTEITPSNIVLLNCVAHFMGISSDGLGRHNLVDQTKKFLEGVNYWTWSELLLALKQCQDLLPTPICSFVLEKVLDCLVGRVTLPTVGSPLTCSSNNSSFLLSCDSSSIYSMRNNWSQTTWWFEDLLVLNANSFYKMIRKMISQKLDHATISRFIIFRLRLQHLSATPAEECKILKVSINLLSSLDRSSLSCKGLFHILLLISSLKDIGKLYKHKLECLIGSLLDQATLDYLLVPSPHRSHHVYDVDLVLRLVKAFLLRGSRMSQDQLKKVASLMDSYLMEIAPDILLKPSKFAALVMVLPDSARECSDRLYQAIDIYLQVHVELSEEETISLCCAVNCVKLSVESLEHLAQNSMFSSRKALKIFFTRQSKFYSSIDDGSSYLKPTSSEDHKEEQQDSGQILIYAKMRGHPKEIANIEAELQGMQHRVREIERVFKMIRSDMSSVIKPRLQRPGKARPLPKLCS